MIAPHTLCCPNVVITSDVREEYPIPIALLHFLSPLQQEVVNHPGSCLGLYNTTRMHMYQSEWRHVHIVLCVHPLIRVLCVS